MEDCRPAPPEALKHQQYFIIGKGKRQGGQNNGCKMRKLCYIIKNANPMSYQMF